MTSIWLLFGPAGFITRPLFPYSGDLTDSLINRKTLCTAWELRRMAGASPGSVFAKTCDKITSALCSQERSRKKQTKWNQRHIPSPTLFLSQVFWVAPPLPLEIQPKIRKVKPFVWRSVSVGKLFVCLFFSKKGKKMIKMEDWEMLSNLNHSGYILF